MRTTLLALLLLGSTLIDNNKPNDLDNGIKFVERVANILFWQFLGNI